MSQTGALMRTRQLPHGHASQQKYVHYLNTQAEFFILLDNLLKIEKSGISDLQTVPMQHVTYRQ